MGEKSNAAIVKAMVDACASQRLGPGWLNRYMHAALAVAEPLILARHAKAAPVEKPEPDIEAAARELATQALFAGVEACAADAWEDSGPWLIAPVDLAERVAAAIRQRDRIAREKAIGQAAQMMRDGANRTVWHYSCALAASDAILALLTPAEKETPDAG